MVTILYRQFNDSIATQREISGTGVAVFVGSEFSNDITVGIQDAERPAAQMVAGVCGFAERNTAVMGIGKRYGSCFIDYNRNLFDGGVIFPEGIAGIHFFGIISSRPKPGDGDGSVGTRSEWGILNRLCTGSVKVQSDLPVYR